MSVLSRSIMSIGVVLLVLTGSTCLAQSQPSVDLKTLKDIYTKAIQKVDADCASAAQALPASYLKELIKHQKTVQAAGDLEGLTTANRELERFKNEQTVPDQPAKSTPEAIRNLQTQYRDAVAKNDLEKNKKTVAVTKQYLENLATMQTSLTKSGNISEALATKAEIQRVKADSKIAGAEAAVATPAVAAQGTDKKPAGKTIADPIIATWRWFNDVRVTCRDDGSFDANNGQKGVWKNVSTKGKEATYEFQWDGGVYIDTLTILRGGKSLAGQNQNGFKVTADRVEP
jgi:hypothetical protein